MSKFKAGDEVVVLELSCGYEGCYKKGDVGVIMVTDGFMYKLNGDEGNGSGWLSQVELVQSRYPNPPHKHVDMIIEGAKGANIEFWSGGKWRYIEDPAWSAFIDYRVAPTQAELEDIKTKTKIDKLQSKIDKLKLTLEEK